ncbi:glycosyltransferase family 25 protein [Pleomassaria siparia CBS 279.74]|uniref:Glycosyltransferase family 25 protein n=1 Tax=Pleomassaria siparia CBS 279.74 TaxID=1314801 RepID=A0A6G1K1Q4_9PLEO|nr:glycosyltransferase family 25 protein [Pleomassaria siparia CBS 279.74]
MTSPRSANFRSARGNYSPWYLSRPRLVVTCCLFATLYLYLHYYDGSTPTLIPEDSFELLKDESLTDIVNSTLGFEKILVLNLPFRTDRRDAMTLAAATSNMKLEFVDGVTGDSIRNSAYPPPEENIKLSAGIRGSWRTHMNALQRIVNQNLTTALIFEDDVDWDVRIRPNLQRFALASRFLSEHDNVRLTPAKYPIDYRPNPETADTTFHTLSDNGITEKLPSLPLSSVYKKPLRYHRQPPPPPPNTPTSPYGDPSQWDILWIGHCGAGFPRYYEYSPEHGRPQVTAANVLLTHANDQSVPSGKWLKAHPFQGDLDPLANAYPPHTRVYHRATGGELCTVGYAVSQRGARRLLHQFGIKAWNGIFDSELGRWCAGQDPQTEAESSISKENRQNSTPSTGKGGRHGTERVCLTSQPPIFAHHHPVDGESDIGGLGGGYANKYETKYLRYSVRMNLERIVQGVKDLVDQWPD